MDWGIGCLILHRDIERTRKPFCALTDRLGGPEPVMQAALLSVSSMALQNEKSLKEKNLKEKSLKACG
ncbi:uncharacterized protein N7487_010430 [Penicillium crustosum]|uniref:uncharacterized protein n=1 Tax=Penicillium crustosum TaxID=36656 RepID=UPI0023820B47|nr:uncharacterized protein N7487_010430 [Penicillium crustosum]KAJ5396127.1 hypothetical protein N7487_010430 [Penicillium crustosum]